MRIVINLLHVYIYILLTRHYKVEKMNMNKGRWEPVAEVTKGLTATVNKLEEGQPYKFRIIAVSSQGESEPLECDTEITAKNPFGMFQTRI